MPKNEKVIDQMARCSFDVRARMDTAVAAILSLCWDYRCVGFSFADFPELDAKVNEILVQMSDGNLSDAEIRAKKAMAEEELQDYEDDAIDFVEGEERNGESVLFRLDRRADHLKELLAGWLAVAAFASLTKTRVMRDFWTYLGNVIASKDWRDSGTPIPKWGRGFQTNILRGITVIEQDTINRAFQYAKVQQFRERGAIGYRTIRNSSFHCPYCDEMTHHVWPLDEVVLPYHPNCVCVAVPIYSEVSNSGSTNDTRQGSLLTEEQKAHRKELQEWARENIKGVVVENKYPITITMRGIKEYLNQPHELYFIKNEFIKELPSMIRESKFVISKVHRDTSNPDILRDHIYRTSINGIVSYFIVWESKSGRYTFHSISDSANVLKK